MLRIILCIIIIIFIAITWFICHHLLIGVKQGIKKSLRNYVDWNKVSVEMQRRGVVKENQTTIRYIGNCPDCNKSITYLSGAKTVGGLGCPHCGCAIYQ